MTLGLIYWLVLIIAIVAWFVENRTRTSWALGWTAIVVIALFTILGFAVFGPLHIVR